MNSRITLSIVALAVAAILHPVAAHARLGETLAQCEARYGKVIKTTKEYHFFTKKPMNIACKFFEGVCESMVIFHTETDMFRHPLEMSDVEIEAILEANSKGSVWTKKEVISVNKEWKTADGLLIAAYFPFQHQLVIMTQAAMDRDNAAKAAEEKAKLKGF